MSCCVERTQNTISAQLMPAVVIKTWKALETLLECTLQDKLIIVGPGLLPGDNPPQNLGEAPAGELQGQPK